MVKKHRYSIVETNDSLIIGIRDVGIFKMYRAGDCVRFKFMSEDPVNPSDTLLYTIQWTFEASPREIGNFLYGWLTSQDYSFTNLTNQSIVIGITRTIWKKKGYMRYIEFVQPEGKHVKIHVCFLDDKVQQKICDFLKKNMEILNLRPDNQ